MPERLECEVLQKARYRNTLTYLPTYLLRLQENIATDKLKIILLIIQNVIVTIAFLALLISYL